MSGTGTGTASASGSHSAFNLKFNLKSSLAPGPVPVQCNFKPELNRRRRRVYSSYYYYYYSGWNRSLTSCSRYCPCLLCYCLPAGHCHATLGCVDSDSADSAGESPPDDRDSDVKVYYQYSDWQNWLSASIQLVQYTTCTVFKALKGVAFKFATNSHGKAAGWPWPQVLGRTMKTSRCPPLGVSQLAGTNLGYSAEMKH